MLGPYRMQPGQQALHGADAGADRDGQAEIEACGDEGVFERKLDQYRAPEIVD